MLVSKQQRLCCTYGKAGRHVQLCSPSAVRSALPVPGCRQALCPSTSQPSLQQRGLVMMRSVRPDTEEQRSPSDAPQVKGKPAQEHVGTVTGPGLHCDCSIRSSWCRSRCTANMPYTCSMLAGLTVNCLCARERRGVLLLHTQQAPSCCCSVLRCPLVVPDACPTLHMPLVLFTMTT